ncbi:MAG: TIGR03564 family F420-dependent LLM class oxidoreductase [Chloroflexi bacterium]|nr:MAG: TIGR03564 family F420-dependent LLM class oxidoreductase [Chloroflexota bacterium]
MASSSTSLASSRSSSASTTWCVHFLEGGGVEMRRRDADPARPDVRAPDPHTGSGLMRVGLLDGGNRDRRPATLDELLARARLAEEVGLSSVWYSNIFGHDAMTVAALAARVTDRIAIGTAITPTYPRHPHAMAQQAASTAAAARGRFTLGVGPSHRVVVEEMWGLSYERAYDHTREYLSVLVPLLSTGKVEHAGTRFTVRAHLTSTDGLPVPVLLSGLGPKMLALAGTLAAGTITWMVGARTLRDHIVPRIREAAAQAGRPAPRIVVELPLALTDDVAAARELARRMFKSYAVLPAYRAMLDREGAAGPAEVAVVGDRDAIGEQLLGLAEAGATDFNAAPIALGEHDAGLDDCLRTLVEIGARLSTPERLSAS